jgi:hypothetical protein
MTYFSLTTVSEYSGHRIDGIPCRELIKDESRSVCGDRQYTAIRYIYCWLLTFASWQCWKIKINETTAVKQKVKSWTPSGELPLETSINPVIVRTASRVVPWKLCVSRAFARIEGHDRYVSRCRDYASHSLGTQLRRSVACRSHQWEYLLHTE